MNFQQFVKQNQNKTFYIKVEDGVSAQDYGMVPVHPDTRGNIIINWEQAIPPNGISPKYLKEHFPMSFNSLQGTYNASTDTFYLKSKNFKIIISVS